MSSSSDEYQFYKYTPLVAAAATFAALFLLATTLHAYQLFRTRTWYLIPLLVGGCCEWIGYVGRAISAHEAPDYSLAPYIIQSLLLLIAPVLFAASIYMVLGHIVELVDGYALSLIKRRYLTLTFVSGDVFAFLVQSSGAGMLAKSDPDSQQAGKYIIIGGLVLQLLSFGFFMVVSIIFHRRLLLKPTQRSDSGCIPWRRHMYVLYGTSILIMIRSIFRTVEYAQGDNGYLLRKEYWLYVFDATLMFLTIAMLNIIHPSEVKALLRGRKATRMLIRTQTLKAVTDSDHPLYQIEKTRKEPTDKRLNYV